MSRTDRRVVGHLMVVLAVGLLALPPLLVRVSQASVVVLLAARFVAQVLVLRGVAQLWPRDRGDVRHVRPSTRKMLLSAGSGAFFVAYLYCFFRSIASGSVERAILLSSLYVLIGLPVHRLIGGRLNSGELVGSILVLAGVMFGLSSGMSSHGGDVLAVGAALLFAGYLAVSGVRLEHASWEHAFHHQLVVSAVGLVVSLSVALLTVTAGDVTRTAVGAGLLVGALGAAGHVALSLVQLDRGTVVASATSALAPIAAALLAGLAFGDSDLARLVPSLALAGLGLVLASRGAALPASMARGR